MQHRGLTLVEVLMLIGIFLSVGVMLFPWIQYSREKARQATCVRHMQKLANAYLGYESANKRFAPSSQVTRNADGKITAVDGWSWMVQVLPFMCDNEHWGVPDPIPSLHDAWNQKPVDEPVDRGQDRPDTAARAFFTALDVKDGRPLMEPAGVKAASHADALATRFPWLSCPSYDGSPYADPWTKKAVITNYRPLGASHIESLSAASPQPLAPKYDPPDGYARKSRKPYHPDGACFPGSDITLNDAGQKGTAWTVWLTESLEPRFSRWTVGAEAAVVGLPHSVEFEADEKNQNLCVPKGYRKALEKDPKARDMYWTYHTYLDCDYDKNPYDGEDGTHGGKYGPSSNHPGFVHHAFLDGSARDVSTHIDVRTYLYLIDRNAPSLYCITE
jgi:type II secretory pathway pseudopilin PulG